MLALSRPLALSLSVLVLATASPALAQTDTPAEEATSFGGSLTANLPLAFAAGSMVLGVAALSGSDQPAVEMTTITEPGGPVTPPLPPTTPPTTSPTTTTTTTTTTTSTTTTTLTTFPSTTTGSTSTTGTSTN